MAVHGKNTVFKLDDLDGSLTDISSKLDSCELNRESDRPETQTFGQTARRREIVGLRRASISFGGFVELVAGTKIHGKTVRALLDKFRLDAYVDSASVSRSADLPPTQTFNDGSEEHGVVGLVDGSISLEGFDDPTVASGINDILETTIGTAPSPTLGVFTLAPTGYTIGRLCEMASLAQGTWTKPGNENDPVRFSGEFMPDGPVDLGVCLHDLTAETGTGNYTGVNETEASANGGVAHLHVTEFTGTNATFKVQHSVDDITYADLITFAVVTATGSERKEVTGTVNQYVRGAISAVTALSSTTFVIAFARRSFAYGTAGTHRHYCGLIGAASSTSFEYGAMGSTSTYPKVSGECRLASYDVTYSENGEVKYSGELVVDGALTEGNW